MRRLLCLCLLAATAACAGNTSSPSTTANPGTGPTRIIQGAGDTGTDVVLSGDPVVINASIPAPPARVFATLPGIYGELGIPVTHEDAAQLTVGNPRFFATRRLAGEPLTALFDCGRSGLGAPLADTYRVRISIHTSATAEAGGSRVGTLIEASAQAPDGAGRDPVVCSSTGRLEQRISQALTLRTAQP